MGALTGQYTNPEEKYHGERIRGALAGLGGAWNTVKSTPEGKALSAFGGGSSTSTTGNANPAPAVDTSTTQTDLPGRGNPALNPWVKRKSTLGAASLLGGDI